MTRSNLISIAFFAALMAVAPFLVGTGSYWITVFIFIGIYSIVTIGLSLLMGYAGQISLGHGAFFGLGAYASGLLTTQLHWNPWLAILAAMVITSIAALLVGAPTLRLSGHYLAMATLALGEIIVIFFTAEIDLTRRPFRFWWNSPFITLPFYLSG